ncbi:hypothetical protein [Marinicella sp. W31]|uniref:hypothetical protein n=1 Tax=Marinicella sp. W31 TaxID=3023713 RepID=UPI0037565A22
MLLYKNITGAVIILITTILAHGSVIEIGPNDVIISQEAGWQGNPNIDALYPTLAYNSTDNNFVAIWSSNANAAGSEIYARLISANGIPIGNQVNVSDIPNSDNLPAYDPDIVYNPIQNEFLVVWYNDQEIFARRLGADLTVLGAEIQISDISPLPTRTAVRPHVAFNTLDDEYLVVWYSDDPAAGLSENEFEVFGQRLTGEGVEIGANDFRVSDVADNGDASRDAKQLGVAFNSFSGEYLVIWVADDDQEGQVDQEFEVFGQLLSADGVEMGVNDFRISTMGGIGEVEFDASYPAVAANNYNGDWMVVWHGDDNSTGLIDGEFEIHGQLLSEAGQFLDKIRLSAMGGTGNTDYLAYRPDVIFNPVTREFLVSFQSDGPIWQGSEPDDDEYEIWVRRLNESGEQTGILTMISDMGDLGSAFDARTSALAVDHNGETMVIWNGSDDTHGGAVGEFGVFGQKLAETPIFSDGFE